MSITKKPKPLGPPKATNTKPRAVPAPKAPPPGVKVRKAAHTNPQGLTPAKPDKPLGAKPKPLPPIRPEQLAGAPKPYEPAVGDVVELKSGGPRMTVQRVERIAPCAPDAFCRWYLPGSTLASGTFDSQTLRQITDNPEDTPERERCAAIVRALTERCQAGGQDCGLIELRAALKAIEEGL